MSLSGSPVVVPAADLQQFGGRILAAVGVPEEEADKAASILVESNLRGVDTHGIYLVSLYARRIEAGLINPKPHFKFHQTRASTAIFDADTGLGQLAVSAAMDHAINLARATGSGTVSVRRSTHFGAGAYYVLQAAGEGMIGSLMSHSETDVVLFGGRKPYLGTNPYAVAVPAGRHAPFVMDMATSQVAFGKVRAAAEVGREIPPDWAVDGEGHPVTDPRKAKAVRPMAGAKGYALGLLIEILSSIPTGMAFGPGIVRKFDDWDHPQQLGCMIQVSDPSAFCSMPDFQDRVNALFDDIRQQPVADNNPWGRILIPGEPEHAEREKRLASGCPVAPEIAAQLSDLGQRLGVHWPV